MAMKYLLSGSPFRDCAAEPDELLTTYSLDCRIVIKNSTPSLRTLCRHNRGGEPLVFTVLSHRLRHRAYSVLFVDA